VEESDAVMWAEQKFGEEYPAASSVVVSCYKKVEEHGDWADRITPDLQGGQMKRASAAEIDEFLKERIKARRNTVKRAVEICWVKLDAEDIDEKYQEVEGIYHAITDEDLNTLSGYIENDCHLRANPEDIRQRLYSKRTRAFNPFVEYVESLPVWQEGDKDYIEELAATLHLRDENEKERQLLVRCLKKWLVGAVRGWTDERVMNQLYFMLQGGQGCNKSTWLSHLMPNELREYHKLKVFGSNFNKDDAISLAENGLIQHDEFDKLGAQQNNDLKAILSGTHTSERAPYERYAVKRKNIASLCGSTNQELFLTDPTGSRRILAFAVTWIDSPYDHPFNYAGIYAQAYALAKDSDFRHYLNMEEQQEIEMHNRQFEVIRCEEELIQRLYRVPKTEDKGRVKWVTPSEILMAMESFCHHFNVDVNILGRYMKKLGFEKASRGHNHRVGYLVVERTYTEIEMEQKQIAMDVEKEKENKVKDSSVECA
jgi:predicted P-loop ATPase